MAVAVPHGDNPNPQHQEQQQQVPTEEELELLLRSCKNDTESLLLMLLSTTGVRIGALVRMRYGDVQHGGGGKGHHLAVAVVREKGGRQHVMPLTQSVAAALHRRQQETAGPYVFPQKRNSQAPINIRCLREVFYRVVRRAKLPHLHPHLMRHAVAHRLFCLDNSVDKISKFLGHRNIQTTLQHYLNLSTRELVDSMHIPWLQH
jgi:integrase